MGGVENGCTRPDAPFRWPDLSESLSDRELAKLFYMVNTFIFEETGKKNREKWQVGAELIGMGSPLADVELIVLALEVLNRLGLKNVELKLSHAGLTRGILQQLSMNVEQQHQIFDRLLDGDASVLNQIKTEKPELAPLLELQGKSSGFVKNLVSSFARDLPELQTQVKDLVFIADTLKGLGHEFQVDIASVRGFEYYTGMIFQLFIDDEKVGGGGRYDSLIPSMGGKNTPASGFALYLDLLMELMPPEKFSPQTASRITVKMDAEASNLGFGMAAQLRQAGFTVKLHLGGKGPVDTSWKLEVRQKPPSFVLIDVLKDKKFELQSSEDVLEKLKR
jgi:histidyl-tRNA synthetase